MNEAMLRQDEWARCHECEVWTERSDEDGCCVSCGTELDIVTLHELKESYEAAQPKLPSSKPSDGEPLAILIRGAGIPSAGNYVSSRHGHKWLIAGGTKFPDHDIVCWWRMPNAYRAKGSMTK